MIHKNYRRIIKLAIPIILANASAPLLGLADTASIGQTGGAEDLGAIALATLIFSFVYWGFGFLRMGTTGFIAQAAGAKDTAETHALVYRSILLGTAIGVFLILLQKPIGEIAISLLSGSEEVKTLVADYFYIRIWGAPATLITYSILGALIGMGWTRQLLFVQVFLNLLNIILNVSFVIGLDMGVEGIALGTVLSEWISLFVALYLLFGKLEIKKPFTQFTELRSRILNKEKLVALFKVNSDIMIRTLALIGGFAYFANQGAKFGDSVLAANHVLLQFVSLSAFFLDGFAHVAEMLSGQAYGAKDREEFIQQVKQSSILAGGTALILALAIYSLSSVLIPLLTRDTEVQNIAASHSIYAAVYILVSFVAFQLDGIFIGVTKSKEMRNATLISLVVFIASALWLIQDNGNTGLWIAFILYVVVRGISLGAFYPRILKNIRTDKL